MSPHMGEEPVSQTAPTVDPQLRRVGMPGLKGKNLLVTGGSSGIGQATPCASPRMAPTSPSTT